jgi:hypothetical protein
LGKGSGNFDKVKTAWYTLGATGFVAVIDVVRMQFSCESEIKRMNALISENIVFRDILECYG